MQGGTQPQSGGFDPGLAALIAAILTGGVGAYGYSQASKDVVGTATETLKGQYEERLRRASELESISAKQEAESRSIKQRLEELQKERDDLAKRLGELKSSMDASSGPALAFQSASSETLKGAVDNVIRDIKGKYPHLVAKKEYEDMLRNVLEYPASYQAKLARLTLPMFYTKQVAPVLQQILAKSSLVIRGGGRRRYRKRQRGGRDATEAEISNYAEAIEAVKAGEKELEKANKELKEAGVEANAAKTQVDPALVKNVAEAAKKLPQLKKDLATARETIRGTDNGKQFIETKEPRFRPTAAPQKSPPNVSDQLPDEEVKALSGDLSDENLLGAFNTPTEVMGRADTIPSYEEFAKIYADAIAQATLTPLARETARRDTYRRGVDAKKDEAAKKAASTIAGKLETIIKTAEADIGKQKAAYEALSADAAAPIYELQGPLGAAILSGKELVASLRKDDVTESTWKNDLKQRAEKLQTSLPKDVKSYVEAVETATKEKVQSNMTVHTKIMKETPALIKKTESNVKQLEAAVKSIRDALKLVPNPEIFAGGCFVVDVLARDGLKLREDVLKSLGEHLSKLKDSFKSYTKETDGIEYVLDSSFYTAAEQRAIDEKREAEAKQKEAELDGRVERARLKFDAAKEILAATVEKRQRLLEELKEKVRASREASAARAKAAEGMDALRKAGIPPPPPRGGADEQIGGVLEALKTLKTSIDDATLSIRKETIPLAGLVGDTKRLVDVIKAVPKKETLSGDAARKEKEACGMAMEEETRPTARLPTNLGEGYFQADNPMFNPEQQEYRRKMADYDRLMEERDRRAAAGELVGPPPSMPTPPPGVAPIPSRAAASKSPAMTGSTGNPSNLSSLQSTPALAAQGEGGEMTPSAVDGAAGTLLTPIADTTVGSTTQAEAAQTIQQNTGLNRPTVKGSFAQTVRAADSGTAKKTGSSRKSTLKKRRGGKQNGRGSRRRKNRADRTHSHAR